MVLGSRGTIPNLEKINIDRSSMVKTLVETLCESLSKSQFAGRYVLGENINKIKNSSGENPCVH